METIQRPTTKFRNLWFKSNTDFTNVLVLFFLFFGIIGIINHEMWRDELHAWMIARDSSSIGDLFKNLRYEGHPGLWHICLYVISRFTRNPMVMQFFHLLLATGVIYVFARFSPFTKLQKILFSFGYFPFYEYSIISRSYVLGVLLIFLICKLFTSRRKKYLLLSLLLALLANTNIYSFIIAISFAITLLFEIYTYRNANKLLHTNKNNLIISAIIFMLGIGVAVIQIIPAADAPFQGNVEIFTKPDVLHNTNLTALQEALQSKQKHLALTIGTIWISYMPIPNFLNYQFWNTNILLTEKSIILQICGVVFSLCFLFFSIALFKKKLVVLCLYISGTFGILLFTYVKYYGSLRHYGHLFILFLACIWILNCYTKSSFSIRSYKNLPKFINKYQNQFITILLCIHFIIGTFAFSRDLINPFSSSKEVASFIESQRLNNTLIIGSKAYIVSPIAALLDRRIYYVGSNKFGSFIPWNINNDEKLAKVNSQEIIDKINKLIIPKHKNALLVLSYELDAIRTDLSISKLLESRQSIAPNETYHLYLIQKKPVGNQPDGP